MAIQIKNVTYIYPKTDVGIFDVNMTIKDGEILAVIGSSGSGKTTLLKLIAGILMPRKGAILLDGKDVTPLPAKDRQLGIVFQSYALFPHMTAWQNISYPLKVRKVPIAERRRLAEEALERVGLKGFADRHPLTLSGGQQQRIALARALIFQPKALLLDEPLSALDAGLRGEMRDEIQRLQREYHIATMHITHDQEEALSMADRIAVMESGKVIQLAPPQELYDFPVTRSVARFVGKSNLWEGIVRSPKSVEVPFGELKTAPHSYPVGNNVGVMVRPERIRIGAHPDNTNTVRGVVKRDRFMGSVRLFDEVYRHPQGEWFVIHQLTIAFLVNTNLIKDVPQSWSDLLKPEYKKSIVYLDPRSTGQGQVLSFAANFAAGGDMNNVQPGIEFLAKMHEAGNVLRVEGTTPYAKFVKGEIPIWIGYENDGLKAKYKDGLGDAIAVVIPQEATVAAPYAISLVKGGPNPNAGKLWLNFIMTNEGQTTFAEGFVRPSVPGVELPADIKSRFPSTPQLRPLDLHQAAARKPDINEGWSKAILGQ
jgi:putative spermidine/putrescine transport system ATP-binding protein